jgi:hypothetical protein
MQHECVNDACQPSTSCDIPWHSWLQGIKKLKNQPMVGFNGRTNGLQFNVGFGGLQDKVLLSSSTAAFKLGCSTHAT